MIYDQRPLMFSVKSSAQKRTLDHGTPGAIHFVTIAFVTYISKDFWTTFINACVDATLEPFDISLRGKGAPCEFLTMVLHIVIFSMVGTAYLNRCSCWQRTASPPPGAGSSQLRSAPKPCRQCLLRRSSSS